MTDRVVVDLFCGAGGASLGFSRAGYDVRGAVDIDDDAIETYKKNLCDTGIVGFDEPMKADLSDDDLSFTDIRDEFGLEKGEVDVICGCPPCQNFSTLRDTTPWPDDEPKDELLRAFVGFIREEMPDAVFFENVQNIMNSGDGDTTYVDWFKRQMNEMVREGDTEEEGGYAVELGVVNAADYGVPQTRNRTIGLCVYGEDEDNVQIPSPTHSKDPDPDSGLRKWVTLAETIERPSLQEELELGKAQEDDYAHRARRHRQSTVDMMEAIRKHGDSWMDLEGTEDEDQIRDCHQSLTSSGAGSAYGILRGDEPAPTLTTRCTNPSSGRYTHHKQNRGLSPREAALLMTFPPNFELPEKNSAAERVVGNAVPPRLVNKMARAIF